MILLLLILYTYWRIQKLKDPSEPERDPRTGLPIFLKDDNGNLLKNERDEPIPLQARDALEWEKLDYFRHGRRVIKALAFAFVLNMTCSSTAAGCDARLASLVAVNDRDRVADDVGVSAGWSSFFGSWRDVSEVVIWGLLIL